jgi:hypothetical protein
VEFQKNLNVNTATISKISIYCNKAWAGDFFSLLQNVQTSSGAQPVNYSMGTGSTATVALNSPLTS